MSYIEFKGTIKKVNLKPGGEKEITISVGAMGLRGDLDRLSGMIDQRVEVAFDSEVVTYAIEIDARTNKPLKHYKVDQDGIVHEVKNEDGQLDADDALGLKPDKPPTKEEQEELDRSIIDEFIIQGFGITYEDLPYDFKSILKRRYEGETYMKLANELQISSGKIVELVDEYRKRLAPMAKAWDEYRQGLEPEAETPKPKGVPELQAPDPGEADAPAPSEKTDEQDDETGAA